jgi:galactokinase
VRDFHAIFGFSPEATATAHGRVNLLGEHTDYNDGYVLPTTIPQSTLVHIARSRDDRHHFHSAQLGERVSFRDGEGPPDGFAIYVHGCIEVMRRRGHAIPPLAVYIDSSVPIGAGLSSSAALEVAVLRALRDRWDIPLDDVELALSAQQAELEFAHVHCGIMDQMACSMGRDNRMLFLDTRSRHSRLLELPAGAVIVIIDSGVTRRLAASGYNERRRECAQAAQLLGVPALRDVTSADAARGLPAPLDRRARHVISENARVLEAAAGVSATRFGELMNASHASLRDDFEVSIPALDTLVDILQRQPRVFGARLTGAGFGGACVALVEARGAAVTKAATLGQYTSRGFEGRVLV